MIWRMGPFGDFTILNPPRRTCGDPNVFPWFTHQHDAAFQTQNGATQILTVFDDGNLATQCGGNSRGMVLFVGEAARQVYIETSADLGGYISQAVGSGPVVDLASQRECLRQLRQRFSSPASIRCKSQSTEVDLTRATSSTSCR